MDTFSIPTGMFIDQPNCADSPLTVISSVFNGLGRATPPRKNPA